MNEILPKIEADDDFMSTMPATPPSRPVVRPRPAPPPRPTSGNGGAQPPKNNGNGGAPAARPRIANPPQPQATSAPVSRPGNGSAPHARPRVAVPPGPAQQPAADYAAPAPQVPPPAPQMPSPNAPSAPPRSRLPRAPAPGRPIGAAPPPPPASTPPQAHQIPAMPSAPPPAPHASAHQAPPPAPVQPKAPEPAQAKPRIAPPPPPTPGSELASIKQPTDLSNCLLPLLEALNWRGDPRHVAESLPHFIDSIDVTSMRNIMATLHYETRPVRMRLKNIDPRLMPCLFLPDGRDAVVLLGLDADGIRVFDGGQNAYSKVPRARWKGTAYFLRRINPEELQSSQQKVGWMKSIGDRFRALFYQTLGLTLVLNILALVTPLFVMAVYDKVIGSGSMTTLTYLGIGVAIALACDSVLREIRSRITAFIGARLDNIVGNAIFQKILFLPPAFTERASIGAQVSRIKDFETIREFFTGPLALMLIELPFAIVFFVVIAALGGILVLVPVIMMAMFVVVGAVVQPLIRTSVAKAGRSSTRRQELVVEALNTLRAIKYSAAEATWLERYREDSAKAALTSFMTGQLSALIQTLSHVIMTAAGIGTIVFGVFRVINGDMSVGGLVASMILVWRVLSPLQSGFVSLTKLTQVKSSIQQINNLMNLRGEREQNALVTPLKRFQGYVSFNRVSLRYTPEADPALVGVSFELDPGEVVCVVGGNGCGKSTVLKLLAGIYNPQAGNIRIDNQDVRQMDVIELRHAIGYVPQSYEFFYGTIAQNLRLAHPVATDADLRWACEQAGVLEDVMKLEQGSGKWRKTGLDVRLGDAAAGHMPTSLLQRLNLARGYLKRAPIMLFDEPGNGLDFDSDQKFMQTVEAMRGSTTCLIVTHRPSHLRIADKILWLEAGAVKAFGPAAEVRKQMPKDLI